MSNLWYNIIMITNLDGTFSITMKKGTSFKRAYRKITFGDRYALNWIIYPKMRNKFPDCIVVCSKNLTGKNKLAFPLIVEDVRKKNPIFISYYKLRKYYKQI